MSDEPRRSIEGELEGDTLLELLGDLAQREATGILTAQSDRDILAVSLEGGAIVGADALNETLEEGLGRVLTGEGLLTSSEFSGVLERVHVDRVRLADALIEDDLLSRRDYLAAVRRYTLELIDRAVEWEHGDYKFYPGDEVSYEEGFQAIPISEILPQARRSDAGADLAAEAEADLVGDEPTDLASGRPALRPTETVSEEIGRAQPATPAPVGWMLRGLERAPEWLGWVAPALIVVLLVGVVAWRPNSIVYPFFWLEPERLELEGERRASVYQKVDRAAKTFFLIEGRFPDDLHTLVVRGLLAPDDIVDARGRILTYVPGDRGYVIRAAGADGTDLGVSRLEAIAGDFLLDPEFVVRDPYRDSVPLVLLD